MAILNELHLKINPIKNHQMMLSGNMNELDKALSGVGFLFDSKLILIMDPI